MKRMGSTDLARKLRVTASVRPLRILCAEDHPQMADVLGHFLRRAGHHPELVDDGVQALARLTAHPDAFDLLITDHQMPRLTGLGLVSKLRDTVFSSPILVFSSMLTAAEVAAYDALAVDHILSKPMQMETLLDVVQNIATRSV